MTMRGIHNSLLLILMVFVFPVGLVGCSKSQAPTADRQQPAAMPRASPAPTNPLIEPSQQPATAGRAESGKGRTDPCALLSSKEIQSIQGESLKDTKSTASSDGGFNLAQCFFVLPTSTNSISVAVTRKGDGAREPKEFWKEKFYGGKGSETRDRDPDKGSGEEKEEGISPRRVSGVGDEAFWIGSAFGGALYVLKGNSFFRVSIGGPGDQRTKINRSKALAQLVLKHLQ